MTDQAPVERLSNSPIARIVGVIADLAGASVVLLLDPVRNFVSQNPFVFYIATVVLLALLIWSTDSWIKIRISKKSDITALQSAHAAEIKRIKLEHSDLLTEAVAKAADLEARLNPSERDLQQFKELLELFPLEKGFLYWLEWLFNQKSWKGSSVAPLYDFIHLWENKFFDDEATQAAYARFYESCGALQLWLSSQGYASEKPDGEGSLMFRLIEGTYREGGWPERDREMRKAGDIAIEIRDARKNFEKVGRSRGL